MSSSWNVLTGTSTTAGVDINYIPNWQVLYGPNSRNITTALGEYWKEVIYEESIGGKACQLTMRFADPHGHMETGPPAVGESVQVLLGYKGQPLSPCGTFQVDEYEDMGPPSIFTVKCLEAGVTNGLRTLNDYSYDNTTLTQIASQVANRLGFTTDLSQVNPDVPYDHITQNHESDLEFLNRIANQHNYAFQIRSGKIIFYSRVNMEAQKPAGVLAKNSGTMKSWRIRQQSAGKHRVYKSVTVGYLNPNTKTLQSVTVTDPSIPTGDSIKAVERVENSQQAVLKANAYLHEHNMNVFQGEIEVVGTMQWRAGYVLSLSGFGVFNNYPWIVDKARHILNRQGWITRLTVRNTLNAQNKLATPSVGYFLVPSVAGTQ